MTMTPTILAMAVAMTVAATTITTTKKKTTTTATHPERGAVEDSEARHGRAQVRIQRVRRRLGLVHLEGVVLERDVLVQGLADAALILLASLATTQTKYTQAIRTARRRVHDHRSAPRQHRCWCNIGRKHGAVEGLRRQGAPWPTA
jgi:hypothetical protein